MAQGALKVLDQTLTTLHPSIRPLHDPPSRDYNKPCFPLGCFFRFRWLGRKFKANLGHNLRVNLLQGCDELVGMIAMIQQNGDFGNVDGFSAKVIQIATQHFNQPLVIRDIGFGAMGKEWKAQSINRKMSLDDERFWGRFSAPKLSPIGAFVMTKAFRLNTGIASVFDRL